MKFDLSKWLPYILVVVAFFAGMLLKTSPDKELKKKWESERETLQDQIEARDARILILTGVETKIREKMRVDSLETLNRLKRNQIEIARLKGIINAINFQNSTTEQLDSIRNVLFSSGR
jgi:hypothetical protein